jgi:hypothetical protein
MRSKPRYNEAELYRLDLERAEGEGMLASPLELQEQILTCYLGAPDERWNANAARLALS